MSAPANPSSTSCAATPRKGLLIHQLDPGSKTSPALYIAEPCGWTNDELAAMARSLYLYQVEKQWQAADAPATVYSFVKHDIGSTKNIVVTESAPTAKQLEDPSETNKIIYEALGERSKATFIVDAGGKFNGMVLMNSADLSGLRAFYGKILMPAPASKTSS